MQRSCLGVGVLRFIITVFGPHYNSASWFASITVYLQFVDCGNGFSYQKLICWMLWELTNMCMSRSHFFVWINAHISARLGLIFQEQQQFSVYLRKLCLLVLKLCKLLPGIPQYTISHKILGNNCISIIYQFLGFS